MNLNWSKAPEWAYAYAQVVYKHETKTKDFAWICKDGYNVGPFTPCQDICHPYSEEYFTAADFKILEFRPSHQAPWDGEGIPPVGTICTCHYRGSYQGKVRVEFIGKNSCVLLNIEHDDEQCGMTYDYAFKPILTPEQIEVERKANEKKDAIGQGLRDVGGHNGPISSASGIADVIGALYEKGWRKQEDK